MLGISGSQMGSQNATNIGRNVPWASQPTVPGENTVLKLMIASPLCSFVNLDFCF